MDDASDVIAALLQPLGPDKLRLSPSALGRFISFEQCQRLFRLELYNDDHRQAVFAHFGVEVDRLPPVLSLVGDEWERAVKAALQDVGWFTTEITRDTPERQRPLEYAVALTADGEQRIVFQSELSGKLDGWQVWSARPDFVLIDKSDPGRLRLLIADLKASREVKLEHRLQVAIYSRLAAELFPEASIEEAVIYREPVGGDEIWTEDHREHRAAAEQRLRVPSGLLLAMADPAEPYHEQIERAILAPNSLARRMASGEFTALPFHLTSKCDVCPHNRFCVHTARELDDLSLIPFLTERDKRSLQAQAVMTISQLRSVQSVDPPRYERIKETPSLGAHVNELVRRADAYASWQAGDRVDTRLPESGYSTLPMADNEHHPNLIKVFLDVQRDVDQGRVYLLGARVSCLKNGVEDLSRQRSVVSLSNVPVEDDEAEAHFVASWVRELLMAVSDLMETDEPDQPAAPIHFYFWDDMQMSALQNLVNRQHGAIIGIDAVMALMMQKAAFDTNNFSVISREIQHQRALPMLCQSLYAVSEWMGFRWNPEIRRTFRFRQFDAVGTEVDDQGAHQVPERLRFSSSIPSEYVHLAWGSDRVESSPGPDGPAPNPAWHFYGDPTLEQIAAFQEERLAAIQYVTAQLRTNKQTTKTRFDLAVLSQLRLRPDKPIEAVREFLSVERHIELSEWRRIRSYSINRRVLLGETLVGRYRDEDQEPEVRILMRDARERHRKRQELGEERYRELSSKERKAYSFDFTDQRIRLRLESEDLPVSVEAALQLNRIKEGALVAVAPAESVDSRLPEAEQTRFQTTAKQILYAGRAAIERISDLGTIELKMRGSAWGIPGFVWGPRVEPFEDGTLYTVDTSPDDFIGQAEWEHVELIRQGTAHSGYAWLADLMRPLPAWPSAATEAQQRYMIGLNRFPELDALAPSYEKGKADYIGGHGDAPMILVQGPPGTGKSTTTGHAILARVQGALAAGLDYRIAVACKTHSATDVLLKAILAARQQLRNIEAYNPTFFAEHFDPRVLDVPLYRSEPRVPEELPRGIKAFEAQSAGARLNEARRNSVVVVGGTTHSMGKLTRSAWKDGDTVWDLVVLDEASQMSVPSFLAASNGLKPDGRIVIVGDHRQMPPIVHQDWQNGEAEALDPYGMYRSVFDVVRLQPDERRIDIKFEESFRIHRDVAELLRREIYVADNIPFHSRKDEIAVATAADAFANAVVEAPYPMILVLHSEDASQQRNPVELTLTERILYALRDSDEDVSLGVVVPHVAQRVELRGSIMRTTDDQRLADSVDTVERFQGDERDVIVVSATESDPSYLRDTGKFLFDPRRLNVAISRARKKLIVIASETVFDYLPSDQASLVNTAIWRNLRNKACTIPIWSGEFEGHRVEVRASRALADERAVELRPEP